MKPRMFVTLVALLAVSGVLAYAQRATINVDFPFKAGDQIFLAGKITVEMPNPNAVAIRNAGVTKVLTVITWLGRHDRDQDFEMVFDKIGDDYYLSEVWFPEEDGYLLLSTKEAHQHAVVGGSNPHR